MDGYSFVYVSLFRDSYCLYPLWNSSCSKKTHLGCKKTHGFVVYSVTHRMRPPPPKKWKQNAGKYVFWILALSRGLWRSHLIRAELSDRLLEKIILFLFIFFNICVCVFCGECGCISVITICVDDNQLWLLWLNEGSMNADWPLWLYGQYLYDYHLYYPANHIVSGKSNFSWYLLRF